MRRTPVVLDVHSEVIEAIAVAAAAARPRETGGLLLGWWDANRVTVRYAVVVPDPAASSTSWNRDEQQAQIALDAALHEHQHPWLGYVGDWHSHPDACDASTQDVAAIRLASRQYTEPLVLLVYRSDGARDHVIAHRGRRRRATIAGQPFANARSAVR